MNGPSRNARALLSRLMRVGRRRSVQHLFLALGFVLAVALFVVLLIELPPWLVDRSGALRVPSADRTKEITEERRTVLALFAAVGAGITLYFTAQRHQLDRDANRTDRYTKAVEQLGRR